MPVNTQHTRLAPPPPRHRDTRFAIPEDEELSDFSFDDGDEATTLEVAVPIPMADTHDGAAEPQADPVVRWVDQQPSRPRNEAAPVIRAYTNNTNLRPRRFVHSFASETPLPALYMNRNSRITTDQPRPPLQRETHSPRSPRTWISEAGPPHYPRHPRYLSHQPRTYQNYGPEPVDFGQPSTDAELLRALNVRSAVDLSVHQYANPYQRYIPVPPPRASEPNNRVSSVRDTTGTTPPTASSSVPSIFSHDSSHMSSRTISTYNTQTLNSQMTVLLSERRAMGVLHDEHMQHKSSNKRKRTFREVIGQTETDPYEKYKFDMIRPRPCVFLKSGLSFDYEDIMKINIVDVAEDLDTFTGFFEFDDQPSLKYWLKRHTPRCSNHDALRDDQSTLAFTAQLVDFEDNDLRFQTMFPDRYSNTFHSIPRTQYEQYLETAAYSKEPHGLHSCLIWSQIDLWRTLPPFENVGRDTIQSIVVCTDCLSDLQKRFVLFKMCFEGSCMPDMVGSLNRATGEMSLVATQDRTGSGTIAMQLIDVGRSTVGKTPACPRVSLSACSKRHSLDSVAIS